MQNSHFTNLRVLECILCVTETQSQQNWVPVAVGELRCSPRPCKTSIFLQDDALMDDVRLLSVKHFTFRLI